MDIFGNLGNMGLNTSETGEKDLACLFLAFCGAGLGRSISGLSKSSINGNLKITRFTAVLKGKFLIFQGHLVCSVASL